MLPKEYTVLFNAITDCIELLAAAQKAAEEIILSKPETTIHVLNLEG